MTFSGSNAGAGSVRAAIIQRCLDPLWAGADPLISLYKPYVDGLDRLLADGRFLLVGNHTLAAAEIVLIPYAVRHQIGRTVGPLADRQFGKARGLQADSEPALGGCGVGRVHLPRGVVA